MCMLEQLDDCVELYARYKNRNVYIKITDCGNIQHRFHLVKNSNQLVAFKGGKQL